jgi:preprotein translocase subunit SecD
MRAELRVTLGSYRGYGKAPVMAGPEDEMAAAARDRLRTSRVDREQVIDTLKSAFVQGFLTKDEFDVRVGQTFTSRTYAELAALTADIRAGLMGAPPSRQPARSSEAEVADSSQNKVVNAGACAMLAVLVLNTAFFAGNFGVFLSVVAAIAVALFIAGARMIYSRHEKRSRGQQA